MLLLILHSSSCDDIYLRETHFFLFGHKFVIETSLSSVLFFQIYVNKKQSIDFTELMTSAVCSVQFWPITKSLLLNVGIDLHSLLVVSDLNPQKSQ